MNHNQLLKSALLEIAKDEGQKTGALRLLDAVGSAAGLMLATNPAFTVINGLFGLAKTVSAALKNTSEIDKINLDDLFVETVDEKLKERGIDDDKIKRILEA